MDTNATSATTVSDDTFREFFGGLLAAVLIGTIEDTIAK